MPPPCSNRFDYFTKGIHPNPPSSDRRTAGAPHTPAHPCSNPKLFWVQCNFCIKRNGNLFLKDDKAWMKSREEQMMHHLKTCCPESLQAWNEIIAWKAKRKGVDVTEMTTTADGSKTKQQKKKKTKKRDGSAATATVNENAPYKKSRQSTPSSTNHTMDLYSSFGKGGWSVSQSDHANTATAAFPPVEHTALNATHQQYFHKICTIATAIHNLPGSFFESPVIKELFHCVRPAMVENGQLPTKQQLMNAKNGYIAKYATEQVLNDMNRVISFLRRYDGLKAAIIVRTSTRSSTLDEEMRRSCTLVCGGEVSCRIVPAIQRMDTDRTDLVFQQGGTSDNVAAIVNCVEGQLRMGARALGKSILGDETPLMSRKDDNMTAEGEAAPVSEEKNEEKRRIQESTGIALIASCLLIRDTATCDDDALKRAQRILSYRWPMICFLSIECLENQLNRLFNQLLVKLPIEDFQEPLECFSSTLRELQELGRRSNPEFVELKESLLKYVRNTYGSEHEQSALNLLDGNNFLFCTSWTPLQKGLASLLRIKRAFAFFAEEQSSNPHLPKQLRCLADPLFWKKIEVAEALIRPLARAALTFKPENEAVSKDSKTTPPTLADLVHILYSLWYAWTTAGLTEAVELVENRWRQYEHPLMILAFLLHPGYIQQAQAFLTKQSQEDGLYSAKFLSNAILGYTVKYLATELAGKQPMSIPLLKKQASEYLYSLENDSINRSQASWQMKNDWKEYWSYHTSMPELSKFALFILGITVQSITTDEMFQELTAQCAQVEIKESCKMAQNSDKCSLLSEHLQILQKSAEPLSMKWNRKEPKTKNKERPLLQILSPVERPSVLESNIRNRPSSAGSRALIHSLAYQSTSVTKDVDKSLLEQRVFSAFSIKEILGKTVVQFWIAALKQFSEEYNGVSDTGNETQECASSRPNETQLEDFVVPQLTLPSYSQAAAASPGRRARRTYRPEQTDFDFMKGWIDTRNQAMSIGSIAPIEEQISQLKNYRANKIELANFFDVNEIPPSFVDSLTQFDDDEEALVV